MEMPLIKQFTGPLLAPRDKDTRHTVLELANQLGGLPKDLREMFAYAVTEKLFPTDAEVKAAEEHAKTGVAKGNDVWIDLTWALISSPEFLLRH